MEEQRSRGAEEQWRSSGGEWRRVELVPPYLTRRTRTTTYVTRTSFVAATTSSALTPAAPTRPPRVGEVEVHVRREGVTALETDEELGKVEEVGRA